MNSTIMTLYQTLGNRNNAKEVNQNGPFKCTRENAWVGEGYYFWDSFIENAHKWGIKGYKSNYLICEAQCEFSWDRCLDLVGNTSHMETFNDLVELMKEEGLMRNNSYPVQAVIKYFRCKILKFKQIEAIRIYGVNSESDNKYKMKFNLDKPQYLDFKPPIQVCLFEKTGLNLKNYHIVYPANTP